MMTDRWAPMAIKFFDRDSYMGANMAKYDLFLRTYRWLVESLGITSDDKVLDIGCGSGEFVKAACEKSKTAVGVDISNMPLYVARARHPRGLYIKADIVALPFTASVFNFVTAISAIEFCFDKRAVLSEVHRVLDKDGLLYIEARNADFVLYRLARPISRVLSAMHLVKDYGTGNFSDLAYRQWLELIEETGFRVVKVVPASRPWNYGGLISRSKNYLAHLASSLMPLSGHYLVGLLCKKNLIEPYRARQ